MLFIKILSISVFAFILIDCFLKRNQKISPALLPYFKFFRCSRPISQFHRLCLKINAWNRLTYSLEWPVISIYQSIKTLKTHGPDVRGRFSIGLTRQFIRMMHLAIRYNLAANTYYYYSFWKNRPNTEYYIQDREIRNLLKAYSLNSCNRRIREKLYTYHFFKDRGILVAPIIASFHSENKIHWYTEEHALPRESIFLKPTSLAGGKGIEKWIYSNSERIWTYLHFKYGEVELLNHCIHLSNSYEIMLQPCLENHSTIRDLSNEALCTARVVTAIRPRETTAQVIMSSFRIPRKDSFMDNFGQGGLVSPISSEGILGVARAKDIRIGEHETHPDTHALILGRELPNWDAALKLAQKAHESVPNLVSVGWDIALTEEGPTLIEANLGWGTQVVQIPGGRPIANDHLITAIIETSKLH